MILYGIPVSTYTAKVRMLLDLKGIVYEMQPPPGGYSTPEYMKIAPLGTIPALKDGDFVISESSVISNYVDEKFPDVPMRPGTAQDRAKQQFMAIYHDLWLEPHLRRTFGHVDPATRVQSELDGHLDKFQDRIDKMEELFEPGPFMCGDQISVADLAFPATFSLADIFLPVFGREVRYGPKVSAWRETIYQNPVVKAVTDSSKQATLDWMNSGGG
ncbi:maleylacetoacetate isomerase [Rhodobacteraceae bacterium KLH11]|nr:maleylacetoacetate isomerase [Rhodobacteraceae bacterium KLH11]